MLTTHTYPTLHLFLARKLEAGLFLPRATRVAAGPKEEVDEQAKKAHRSREQKQPCSSAPLGPAAPSPRHNTLLGPGHMMPGLSLRAGNLGI